MRKLNRELIPFLTVLFLATLPAFGQQLNVGAFTGTVTDPSGAAIPNAQVTIQSQTSAFKRVAETNTLGVYRAPELQLGAYTITVQAKGFQKQARTNIEILAGQTFTVNFTMKVGAMTQVVTVTGAPPLLDTSSSNMGSDASFTQVQKLPISLSGSTAREAISVAETMPGVNQSIQQGQAWTNVSRGTLNGIPPGQFGYEIDGLYGGAGAAESAEERVSAPPEDVQEVRLTTNTDASAGWNGGVTLSIVTRSGTDQYHGDLYYYVRNQAFDAREFFLPKVPQDQQNQAGGVIGGPVKLPILYTPRNKTYFFAYYDEFRYHFTTLQGNGGTTTVSSVPTQAMKNGDFSSFLGPQVGTDALGRPVFQGEIYDPTTTRQLPNGTFIRDPFPGNMIPAADQSSISQAFQKGFANPNLSGNVLNWSGTASLSDITQGELYFKLDEDIGSKSHITFSRIRTDDLFPAALHGQNGAYYIFGSSGYLSPQLSNGFIDDRDEYMYKFSYTYAAKPNLLFDFRAGVNGSPNRHNGVYPEGAQVGYAKQVGLTGTITGNTPNVNIDGTSGFGLGFEGSLIGAHAIPVNLDVAWSKGSHEFKFGAQYLGLPFSFARLQASASGTSGVAGGSGQFNFSRNETGLPGFEPATGVGYASYLTGWVGNGNMSTGFDGHDYTAGQALYIQDKWRATPKLTLSYGLRWEIWSPMISRHDQISNFDPSIPNPAAGDILGAISFFGDGPGRNGLHALEPYYFHGFAPNVGFAYSPDSKTVFRADLGISYLPMQGRYYGGTGQYAGCDGFCFGNVTQSLNNGVTPAFNWNNGYPVVFPSTFPIINPSLDNGSAVAMWPRNDNRLPMVENFGVQVGRQFGHGFTAQIAYVGTMVHRLYTNYSIDSLPLSDLSLGPLLLDDINSPEARAANIPIPYPGFKGSVAQALLPYPQYTGVTDQQAEIGNSTYNALQIVLQKRLGPLSLNSNYTWEKMLTNANVPGSSSESNLQAQSPVLRNDVKAFSTGDIPWTVNLDWIYTLPFGKGHRFLANSTGVVDRFVNGWQLSAIQQYRGGQPIQVTTAESIPGLGGVWADLVPGVPIALRTCNATQPRTSAADQLNINAFKDPAPFTLGNTLTLPTVRACGYFDEDVGLEKDVAINERWHLHIGALAANLLNRHFFAAGSLQRNIDVPQSFGQYTGLNGNPRQVQLYMKLSF